MRDAREGLAEISLALKDLTLPMDRAGRAYADSIGNPHVHDRCRCHVDATGWYHEPDACGICKSLAAGWTNVMADATGFTMEELEAWVLEWYELQIFPEPDAAICANMTTEAANGLAEILGA